MFERMIRQEIDGGVCCGRFPVNANFEVGWVPGYRKVQEFDTVIGFEGRVDLDAALDCISEIQYVISGGPRGVVKKEYVVHISGVKG
jgi:hypothetical protein